MAAAPPTVWWSRRLCVGVSSAQQKARVSGVVSKCESRSAFRALGTSSVRALRRRAGRVRAGLARGAWRERRWERMVVAIEELRKEKEEGGEELGAADGVGDHLDVDRVHAEDERDQRALRAPW